MESSYFKITTVPTCSQSSPPRLWHYEPNLKKRRERPPKTTLRREDDGFSEAGFPNLEARPSSSLRYQSTLPASTTYLLPASTASHWRLISSPHCMLVGASAYGDFCPWFFFLTAFFWILTQWSSKKNLINYDSSCWTAIQGEQSQPESLFISPVYLYLCNQIWV